MTTTLLCFPHPITSTRVRNVVFLGYVGRAIILIPSILSIILRPKHFDPSILSIIYFLSFSSPTKKDMNNISYIQIQKSKVF